MLGFWGPVSIKLVVDSKSPFQLVYVVGFRNVKHMDLGKIE